VITPADGRADSRVGELLTAVSWRVSNASKGGGPPSFARRPEKVPALAFLGGEEEEESGRNAALQQAEG